MVLVQSGYYITISYTGGNRSCHHRATAHVLISPDLGRLPPGLWGFLRRIPVIFANQGSIHGVFSDEKSPECFWNLSRKKQVGIPFFLVSFPLLSRTFLTFSEDIQRNTRPRVFVANVNIVNSVLCSYRTQSLNSFLCAGCNRASCCAASVHYSKVGKTCWHKLSDQIVPHFRETGQQLFIWKRVPEQNFTTIIR
jgi:hypothetical protein